MTNPCATAQVLYEHRQTGWVMLVSALVPLAVIGSIEITSPAVDRLVPPALLSMLAIAAILLLTGFASLSVTVTRTRLIARFGVGLVGRTIALDDVVATRVGRTRWYEGWGIHWTRRGMLYNVAGFETVELDLRTGRRVRIGSDDAARLAATVARAIDGRRSHVPL